MAQYAAMELMTRLQVLVCRTSLLQLTSSARTLHQRYPHPASLTLRLLPPARRDDPRVGANGAGTGVQHGTNSGARAGEALAEGWQGSTAVMSYFLSELGLATSLTALSLQGWQELSARDLHHVAACYPRLARLHLAGLPHNNFLSGGSLGPLGRTAPGLRELAVEAQLIMEPQAALETLGRLPRLASLELSGLPLLPSLDLPLHRLSGLSRLALTFEHKHANSEQQLEVLGQLPGLRHLALDFMQLGTGSSLWSAGWLLTHVLSSLTALTTLHLPRAFLYDKSHPDFLLVLASLTGLTDLALGSIILSPETAAAAAAARTGCGVGGARPGACGPVNAAPSPTGAAASPLAVHPAAAAGTACPVPGTAGGAGSSPLRVIWTSDAAQSAASAEATPAASAEAASPPAAPAAACVTPPVLTPPAPPAAPVATLARPWRRLALGAAMPCYLECLLPLLGIPAAPLACPSATTPPAAAPKVQPAGPRPSTPPPAVHSDAAYPTTPSHLRPAHHRPASPPRAALLATPGPPAASCAGAWGRAAGGAGLDLLELSTPCTLQMVQMLPQFVSGGHTAAAAEMEDMRPCSSTAAAAVAGSSVATGSLQAHGAAAAATPGVGRAGAVREVRLLLRLASNWPEVLGALAGVGPALTSLALMPTYLYGSGTMLEAKVLSCVAAQLPHLAHLELYRLNTDPRDIACLAKLGNLRYVLLGVADAARERRGAAHPAALVQALLAALCSRRSSSSRQPRAAAGPDSGDADLAGAAGPSASDHSGAGAFHSGLSEAGGSGNASCTGTGGGSGGGFKEVEGEGRAEGLLGRWAGEWHGAMRASASRASGEVVVCCPDLAEGEAARLDEACEAPLGRYCAPRMHRWLRVERQLDQTLPLRLAVGCSMAPGRWQV